MGFGFLCLVFGCPCIRLPKFFFLPHLEVLLWTIIHTFTFIYRDFKPVFYRFNSAWADKVPARLVIEYS
jgi:hypothetical protein